MTLTAQAQFTNACGQAVTTATLNDYPLLGCAPSPFGGTSPFLRVNPLGAVVWWYCPLSDGAWSLSWRVATSAMLTTDFVKDMSAKVASAASSPSPTSDLFNLTMTLVNKPVSDPALAAVWCPIWPEMVANWPAPSGTPLPTSIPPRTSLTDPKGGTWVLVGGMALRNNIVLRPAAEILLKNGLIYVREPTTGIWWRWLAGNSWLKLTTTHP